ncbi:MAG TPA: ATP-binding protein [Tepidisphaeraceae bacterium]|jgi:signal transduction histidine kinase|nr:ATP-binding protein [Tepidisphaeraceae bacterium]
MLSLRSRLMFGVGIATTAIFVAATLALYLLAKASLIIEFDSTTLVKARAIASMAEIHRGRMRIEEVEEGQLQEFARTSHPEYFQITSDDGNVLAQSANLNGARLSYSSPVKSDLPAASDVILPDGRRGRQTVMRFSVHADDDDNNSHGPAQTAMLAVARSRGELDGMLARFRWLLALVCGAATVVLLTLTAILIRRGLRPVEVVAGSIARLGEKNLLDRLAPSNVPRELLPIVQRLNELLCRLDSAFEREKSFTADAAHELRTPLAGLEAALGVCARKPRSPEKYAEVVNDCLAVVRGMYNMIENLLTLARADAAQIQIAMVPCHIDEILENVWMQFKQRAEERAIKVTWDVSPNLVVQTDCERLIPVLVNLFDNAVRYSNQGGDLRVCACAKNSDAIVRIANSGSRVRSEDATRVFDRFWRADPARSDIGTSCGLGLSVCQKMIATLNGAISATSSEGGEFSIEIRLPV